MYLVPAPDDDDADDGFGEDFDENFDPDAPTLTPRQCHVVAQVAREFADTVFADTHLLGDRPVQPSSDAVVLAEFPECTWAQDATWRRTMARAFDDLAADAAAGTDPEPRCTGEEMALHLIIDRAPHSVDVRPIHRGTLVSNDRSDEPITGSRTHSH